MKNVNSTQSNRWLRVVWVGVVTLLTGSMMILLMAILSPLSTLAEVSCGSLQVTHQVGDVTTRALTITNDGLAPLDFGIGTGSGVSFFAASTELYGYDVPDAWLRVVGTQDDTHVRVINLDTGTAIAENTDLDRYEIWDVYPSDGTFYKVEADKPVVGYESDLDPPTGLHTTFVPSLDSGPVGTEFIFYYLRTGHDRNAFYVFAVEDASVEVYDTSGSLVASQIMSAGEYWDLSLSNAVYHAISTGRIAMETVGVDGYTTVPSSEGNGVGRRFYFATDSFFTGAFAVFAYQDVDVNVYDLDSGSPLYSQHINHGDYWWQTGVGTRRLRLESTGKVEVWAGDAENGYDIENLGDDLSFAGGDGSREYYLHSLMDGSVIFVLFDNTQVDVDGTVYYLNKDEYLHLDGCCYFRHIQSSQPILIQTLGRDSSWNNMGTYLGGVVVGGGLETSSKTVNASAASPGTPLTYTITLRNITKADVSNVVVTDTVPVSLTYNINSLSATAGSYGYTNRVITWTGSVNAGGAVTITFGATVSQTATPFGSIVNSAVISGGGEIITRTATVAVEPQRIYLPIITRNYCPDFFDDFSNPASGWSVIDDSFRRSEYLNGEYRILTKRAGYFYLFKAPTCDRQNYVVEADARWVGAPGHSYGLIFGVTSGFSQYYLFDMNTDYREFRLLRRDAGGFTTIVPATYSAAINGGTASNHLKVTRNGAQITLEVNGSVLGTWSDGTITGFTGVGIVSSPYSSRPTSDARFDNFSVISLPGSGAAAQGLSGAAAEVGDLQISGAHRAPVPADIDQWPRRDDVEPEIK